MNTLPFVNINGTTRENLVQERVDVASALLAAAQKLRETCPHGRNAFNAEHLKAMTDLWEERGKIILDLATTLMSEAQTLHDGGGFSVQK